MKEMKNKLLIFISLFLLISIINTHAFGVSTKFYKGNPLVLEPGETAQTRLKLQNMVGSEDLIATADITSGSEIAKIIDKNTEYLVPLGTTDTKVNLEISIPENIPLNTNYDIKVYIKTSPVEEHGNLALGTGMTVRIPVEIKLKEQPITEETIPEVTEEKPAQISIGEIPFTTICFTLIIVILIVVFYFIWKKEHEK